MNFIVAGKAQNPRPWNLVYRDAYFHIDEQERAIVPRSPHNVPSSQPRDGRRYEQEATDWAMADPQHTYTTVSQLEASVNLCHPAASSP